ncbi:MAG TPA: hypothetical protein VK474_08720, partial [Chthoniobacterales bacterium]|nr:hypothetical protein [Chthoniobacterales bacterium]
MKNLALFLLVALALAIHASTSSAATLSVGISEPTIGLYQSHGYATSFRVTRGGWDGPVNITYSGMPNGVVPGRSEPTTVAIAAGQSAGRYAFEVGYAVPPGSYPITITASGNSLTATGTFTLVIKAPLYKGRVSLGYQTRKNACTWQVNATYDVEVDYTRTPARLRISGSRASMSTAGSSCSSVTTDVDVTVDVTSQFPNMNMSFVLLSSSQATETVALEGNAQPGNAFPIHISVGYTADNGGGGTLAPFLIFASRQEVPELHRKTSPAGSGSITASPSLTTGYPTNSLVALTAVANAGKIFTGWSGDVTGNSNPVQITMSRDKFVTANFAEDPTQSPGGKLGNISTRLPVGAGDNALIAGFIITGNQPKRVLIRGLGPSLPVPGALRDPTLDLDRGTQTNDDWRSSQEQEI